MEVDIFKARGCKKFIDGYCTLTGKHCVASAYNNGDREDQECNDFEEDTNVNR